MREKKNNSKSKERRRQKEARYHEMRGQRKRLNEDLRRVDIGNIDEAPDYPSFEKMTRKSSHVGAIARWRTERRLVERVEAEHPEDLIEGLVLEATKEDFLVHTEGGILEARIPRRMLQLMQSERNFLTVGDRATLLEVDGGYELLEVGDRKNVLKRKDNFYDYISHAIAANIDRMVIVSSYKEPEIKWGLIDRFLVAAFEEGIEPCIAINKADLTGFPFGSLQEIASWGGGREGMLEAFLRSTPGSCSSLVEKHRDFFLHPLFSQIKHYRDLPISQEMVEGKELAEGWGEEVRGTPGLLDLHDVWLLLSGLAVYKKLGYSIFLVSATTGDGMESLKAEISGKISLFCGHSGVGKSSIINAIEPDFNLKTSDVSSWSGKGQRTTSSSRLLPFGDGFLIDTPGIRTLETHKPRSLAECYPEFGSGSCRFVGCTHTHEADCGVKGALKEGRDGVSFLRYRNYLAMVEEC